MAAAQSPSSSFPMLPGSPYGVLSPGPDGGGLTLSGSMNWEPVRKRLLGDDLKDAFDAVQEIRDRIEIVHTVEFPLMLSALLPAFSTILAHRTKPSPDNTTIEHNKTKANITEIDNEDVRCSTKKDRFKGKQEKAQ